MSTLKILDKQYLSQDPMLTYFEILAESIIFGIIDDNFEAITAGASPFPRRMQKIELELPQIPQEGIDFAVQTIQSQEFITHRARINLPDVDDDVNTFNYSTYQTDAFSYYNIKNPEYEDLSRSTDEKNLPNFCLGALWSTEANRTAEIENYYTMAGLVPSMVSSGGSADILAPGTPINNYEFDDEYLNLDSQGITDYKFELAKDYFKNLTASGSVLNGGLTNIFQNSHVYVDFNYTSNDSEQIGNVPFFNRIRLPAINKTGLIINSNGIYVQEFEENRSSKIVEVFETGNMTDRLIKSFRGNTQTRAFIVNGETKELKVYDVLELYRSTGFGAVLAKEDEMYLRSAEQEFSGEDNPFVFYLNKLILLGKIRTLVKSTTMGFDEIIANKRDHGIENVGFKVIKRRSDRIEPIQTFYFLNRPQLRDFVDTQIAFDRAYQYDIIAMIGVFGSRYTYENITVQENSDGRKRLTFNFNIDPSIQIVEVPMGPQITLRVVEPPPIVPEVTFYNEMTSKNKVKIRLEHQDGNIVDEYSKREMPEFRDNIIYIGKLRQYFKTSTVQVESGKTSDGVYEIYRLDYPPTSYLDFEDALIKTVSSGTTFMNGYKSRNVMTTDMIKHQKKYYYCFRTLTHRGNPSQLSPVYVVEMYEDADETFLTFDLYEPEDPKLFQKNITMRKYLQIIPNFQHTVPNNLELLDGTFDNATDALNSGKLKLGNPNVENIWQYKDKTNYIKLRLESKSSGRKMDLNLYFEIKKEI